MSYERVSLEYEGKVAVLKFDHPEVMNAVGSRMLQDLQAAVREVRDRGTDVRALLITGEGRGFCAGANLADEDRARERETQGAGDGLRTGYHPLLVAMRDLEVPIVTAVNGAAAGVGMSFAMMGDIVCAGRSAFFLQAFARIGLIPDGGATFLLPRMVGWGRAMELSMLAERLPAEKALEWGLVNRVFVDEELVEESLKIARRLADGPRSLSLIRKAYWQTWSGTFESQLDLEAQLQNQAGWSSDFKEGVSAFLEKRDAAFMGE